MATLNTTWLLRHDAWKSRSSRSFVTTTFLSAYARRTGYKVLAWHCQDWIRREPEVGQIKSLTNTNNTAPPAITNDLVPLEKRVSVFGWGCFGVGPGADDSTEEIFKHNSQRVHSIKLKNTNFKSV
uniref:Uncharacterized protein n=1 Tax=Vespula pensylvanica TaxID=30213 RepID=A0A834NQG8_VESPE|nr:hypothetical protein H0235_012176 [Vespula pensylvanica]